MIRAALAGALAPMAAYRQFICYKVVPSEKRAGKFDKLPIDYRTGNVANAHDPNTWTDSATACQAAEILGAGVGFVFTSNDPFFFLDLDNCVDASGAAWNPLALSLMSAFPGAAVEVSQSGKGLHIFGTGAMPAHGCKNIPYGLELYDSGRFVALTGSGAVGNAGADMSAVLPWLVQSYFPNDTAAGTPAEWTDAPCETWNGPTDDDQLIQRALRSQSSAAAFGNKASFADLWEANIDALSKAYPDATGANSYDASSADAALAQHLAFWTGKDCARIERLMKQSALARPKYEREDYLPRTITAAVSRQTQWLTDKHPEAVPGLNKIESTAPRGTLVTGSTILTPPQQLDTFAGCVYVENMHRVLTPGGRMLKPEQFKVSYGGYSFVMDLIGEKTTKCPWEAFTQSQAVRNARADTTCFRPALPFGHIVDVGGRTKVNTYCEIPINHKPGDASKFLNHLAKLLPDERDRAILLSYMAACVQHKGVKFQWAPLIQGVEGNGKTLFTRCVAEAVGERYTHWPKASQLGSQFNSWLLDKVFYAVEDIFVSQDRAEMMEELKPMITGRGIEIQHKGVDQFSGEICGNFIFNSNHKDAIRKTGNDRRFGLFFTAQQEYRDLVRDQMTNGYFPDLYDWLNGEGKYAAEGKNHGYEIVTELLMTFPIPPEFNPAGACDRAPETTSTQAAVAASLGPVEQEILDCVEQNITGFRGGWISSSAVDTLLQKNNLGRRIPVNKRRDLLKAIGYEWHPALKNGRVNNPLPNEPGKPKLYIKTGHPDFHEKYASVVVKLYLEAQNVSEAEHST